MNKLLKIIVVISFGLIAWKSYAGDNSYLYIESVNGNYTYNLTDYPRIEFYNNDLKVICKDVCTAINITDVISISHHIESPAGILENGLGEAWNCIFEKDVISVKSNSFSEIDIIIYAISGEIVYSSNIPKFETVSIDLRCFSKGIYIICIEGKQAIKFIV